MGWQGPGSDLGISGPIPIVVFSSPTFSTQTHLKLSELTRSPQHLLLVADTYNESSVQRTQMQNCRLTAYLLGLLSPKLPVPATHSKQAMPEAHPYGYHLPLYPVLQLHASCLLPFSFPCCATVDIVTIPHTNATQGVACGPVPGHRVFVAVHDAISSEMKSKCSETCIAT